jgi:hypothetical protein
VTGVTEIGEKSRFHLSPRPSRELERNRLVSIVTPVSCKRWRWRCPIEGRHNSRMNWLKSLYPTLLAMAISTTAASQTAKHPFAVVPTNQRAALTNRLIAYTTAFRKKDWASLYDLVSDENKINHKPVFSSETKKMSFVRVTVSRRAFIRDMHGTYDLQRLIKFVPVRTDVAGVGAFNVYGCGELPSGNEKIERIAAVRAVREHGDWYFTNWDYPDPPEPCSNLSDPAWKPARYLQQLDEPMAQVTCILETCEL